MHCMCIAMIAILYSNDLQDFPMVRALQGLQADHLLRHLRLYQLFHEGRVDPVQGT